MVLLKITYKFILIECRKIVIKTKTNISRKNSKIFLDNNSKNPCNYITKKYILFIISNFSIRFKNDKLVLFFL